MVLQALGRQASSERVGGSRWVRRQRPGGPAVQGLGARTGGFGTFAALTSSAASRDLRWLAQAPKFASHVCWTPARCTLDDSGPVDAVVVRESGEVAWHVVHCNFTAVHISDWA
jgi:hypothetical protein